MAVAPHELRSILPDPGGPTRFHRPISEPRSASFTLLIRRADSSGMSMRVFLDGRELVGAGETLAFAIESARRESKGRLIIEACADGETIAETDLEEPPQRTPYAEVLEFFSADVRDLVSQTLSDAAQALADLDPMHQEAAAHVQAGRIGPGLESVLRVLQSWGAVRRALELASQASASAGYDLEIEGGELAPVLATLAERLTEMKRAIARQDWSSLADVLAYDMGGQAERCRAWLVRASARTT